MTEAATARRHPPGTIIIPCHDLARYHHFTHDLCLLDTPDGTEVAFTRSSSIVQNMNLSVETMGDDSMWALVLGDDHLFGRELAMRLLDHEVDIVAPLCVRRGPPFTLVSFDREDVGGDEDGNPLYHTVQFADLPEHGLVEVVATGTAGMLIRRHVLDAVTEEFGQCFANSDGLTIDEDVTFCKRARALGFKIMLDVDTSIGHVGLISASASYQQGAWGLLIDFFGRGENKIFLPGGVQPGGGSHKAVPGDKVDLTPPREVVNVG